MVFCEKLSFLTAGRGFVDITDEVQGAVRRSGVDNGVCIVFAHHTSAGVILCENADPDVRRDLENFFTRLVADGDSMFRHTTEGPDDMPAHVRTVLTQSNLSIPVDRGRCDLGTWQGIYLWEHRVHGHRRQVSVTVLA